MRKQTKQKADKMKLTKEQKLYLATIEQIENEVIKGTITDEQFHNNMETLKYQFTA